MRKRILNVFLALTIAFSAVIMSSPLSYAKELSGKCGDDVYWSFDDSTGKLSITGSGEMDSKRSLFTELNGYTDKVYEVEIGSDVQPTKDLNFFGFRYLKSVTVNPANKYLRSESNVLYSKDMSILYCFPRVGSPTDFTVPSSVTNITWGAFADCVCLKSIKLHGGIKNIGASAFEGCTSLSEIEIPEGMTEISTIALTGSGIEELKISSTVSDIIIDNNFSFPLSLKKITVAPENENFYSDANGVLYSEDRAEIICYPARKKTKFFTVPDSVKTIGDYAFFGCDDMVCLTLSDGVEKIGRKSLSFSPYRWHDGKTNVEIPKSVKEMEWDSFETGQHTNIYYLGTKSEWKNIEIIPQGDFEGSNKELELSHVKVSYGTKMPVLKLFFEEEWEVILGISFAVAAGAVIVIMVVRNKRKNKSATI